MNPSLVASESRGEGRANRDDSDRRRANVDSAGQKTDRRGPNDEEHERLGGQRLDEPAGMEEAARWRGSSAAAVKRQEVEESI